MQLESLSPLVLLTYAALAGSVVAIWLPFRFAWATLLVAAVVLGYLAGVLSAPAILPIAVLGFACWWYRAQRDTKPTFPGSRLLLGLAIVAVALLLGFHVFPGFHNPIYVKDLLISPGARPLTRHLNFDVWVVGVLILGLCYQGVIRNRQELVEAFRRAWPVIAINLAVLIPLALALGFVRPDPKWTAFFWPWAAIQLLFVISTEEAFFRGFIQRELSLALRRHRLGQRIAIGTAAVLFGVAHFGGGAAYVLLATVAGVGYGIAFQRSGRIEMSILAHFSVNATRFLFFTYPYLA